MANDRGLDFERIRQGLTADYPRAADMPGAGFAAGPCLFKQVGGDVHSRDDCAGSRGGNRKVAGAASHVQQQQAGLQSEPGDEFFPGNFDHSRDLAKISGHPHALESGL